MTEPSITHHTCAQLEEAYDECRHPSGLRILVSHKDFATCHAVLRVACGAVDRKRIPGAPMGLAHFLEHKMFERAGGSFDEDFAAIGAEANAYTTEGRTAYTVTATDRYAEAITLLCRMVASFDVTSRSVARERGIIAEELRMNADDPWEVAYAALRRSLYRRHPIREEICGTEASLRRITPRRLRELYDTFYRPDHMVLSVAGPVTVAEVLAAVDKGFGADKSQTRPPVPPHLAVREMPTVRTSGVTLHSPTAKPLFAIGIKASGAVMPEPQGLRYDITLTVLMEMLFSHAGDFYHSLFESGMIGPDLSYDVSMGRDFAYCSLAGECEDPEAVYEAFLSYMEAIRCEGLSSVEFERARRILYGDYIASFDSAEDIADSLGGYEMDCLLAGGRVGLYDLLGVADTLTLMEVQTLFAEIFIPTHFTHVSVWPSENSD